MHTYKIVEHNWNQGNRWTVSIDGEPRLGAVNLQAARAFVFGRIYFEQAGYKPDELISAFVRNGELKNVYCKLRDESNAMPLPLLPVGISISMRNMEAYT